MIIIKIDGIEAMLRKLDRVYLMGAPLKRAFTRSVMYLESRAKENTPVDTGRLRSSITHAVDSQPVPMWGATGSRVHYAPYVEFGTKAHWPPQSAMQPWAVRHGFPTGKKGAFLVARAIARRGTKAHLMFTRAMRESLSTIQGYFNDAAREIEERWKSGA